MDWYIGGRDVFVTDGKRHYHNSLLDGLCLASKRAGGISSDMGPEPKSR